MEIIMTVSGIILMLLFLFIVFISTTIIISFFIKTKKENFEPKISIIIPCYNEEKNIAGCIESINRSNYKRENLEIIAIDDGSTDSTAKILKKYNIKIIKSSHLGKPEALNLGVKEARHEFILALDADTVIDKNFIKHIIKPFKDKNVGATNGSCLAKNEKNMLETFQKIEYFMHSMIRKAFSDVYSNGLWFFGAFSCFRKSVLEKAGYFKNDTMAEDMDIFLEIYSKGYKIINVSEAIGYTEVSSTIKGFLKQRARWSYGGIQALIKNKKAFRFKTNPSVLFLFINQWWWTFYAGFSFFIVAYQFNYWLPTAFSEIVSYTIRWFSLLGPIYVIYKIPEWGISFYSIFGVLSGLLNVFVLLISMHQFNEKITIKNAFAIFFYFPYTILMNVAVVISLFKWINLKNRHFLK